jgi:ankyrin repeat protein
VSAGHENVVQELLGAGADVNATNDKGLTPLYVGPESTLLVSDTELNASHYAASKGRVDVCTLLVLYHHILTFWVGRQVTYRARGRRKSPEFTSRLSVHWNKMLD